MICISIYYIYLIIKGIISCLLQNSDDEGFFEKLISISIPVVGTPNYIIKLIVLSNLFLTYFTESSMIQPMNGGHTLSPDWDDAYIYYDYTTLKL